MKRKPEPGAFYPDGFLRSETEGSQRGRSLHSKGCEKQRRDGSERQRAPAGGLVQAAMRQTVQSVRPVTSSDSEDKGKAIKKRAGREAMKRCPEFQPFQSSTGPSVGIICLKIHFV